MKNCINLGCGTDHKNSNTNECWWNIDESKEVKPQHIIKMGIDRLPFLKNSIDYIYCKHAFEHFENWKEALEEMYRVSKNHATWTIIVPYMWAKQDILFHKKMGFHENTFEKFSPNNTREYYSKIKLETIKTTKRAYGLTKLLPFKNILSYFLNNIYLEIEYTLKVIK